MKNKIQKLIQESMKSKDQVALAAYRYVLAGIQEKESRINKDLSDDEILKIIDKESKVLAESAQYGNLEAEKQSKILKDLLPQGVSETDYVGIVDSTIQLCGAKSVKDLGRVMKILRENYSISLDYSKVSVIVKSKLS